jgi:hypothetical protein
MIDNGRIVGKLVYEIPINVLSIKAKIIHTKNRSSSLNITMLTLGCKVSMNSSSPFTMDRNSTNLLGFPDFDESQ